MTADQLKVKYPDQTITVIGVCKVCEAEVAISPSPSDRGMTKSECRALFFAHNTCMHCEPS